jgi:hypothetical protein
MPVLRRLVALIAVVAALGGGLASPAHADHRPEPIIGDVCDPDIAMPGVQTVDFWVENRTDLTFYIAQSHLNGGEWGSTAPPVKIEPFEWECWRNVYNGHQEPPGPGSPGTAAAGWVTYLVDKIDSPQTRWTLVWRNPSAGGNSFECRSVFNHRCTGRPHSGDHRDHPTPIFVLAR